LPYERRTDTIKVAKPVTLAIRAEKASADTYAYLEYGFVEDPNKMKFGGKVGSTVLYGDSTFSVRYYGPSNWDFCDLERTTGKEATGLITFHFRRSLFEWHYDDTTYVTLRKTIE